ncbi:5-formyltetrahydrofolate cyclo-ligase [Kineococcus glutinatus]|uniref:5-formyltetrahydrofolate cyclo-ligase n=1 Tax=Kineococcus glutinatus TaxID=1070872 RepID=A0ABP9I9Z8_9ACTN
MTPGPPAADPGAQGPGSTALAGAEHAPTVHPALGVRRGVHVRTRPVPHPGQHPGRGGTPDGDPGDTLELAGAPHRLEVLVGTPPDVRSDVEGRKAVLRRSVRQRRRARTGAEADAVDRDLARSLTTCPLLRAVRTVACYTSLPGEPGTRGALDALQRDGVEVIVPVLLPDADLDWTPRADPAPRTLGTSPHLLGPGAVAEVDLLLVPALAVDTEGHRLGQGGGSYDRALRRVPPRVPVIALVHDDELLDAAVSPVPTLPHDRHVDAVITPTRWLWLRR